MSLFPTARTLRPVTSVSVAAQTLTEVLGGESVATVPDLLDGVDLSGVDLSGTERTWRRLSAQPDADVELWLITWPVGTSTGWHDHGSASGAFTTLRGSLTEFSWNGSVHVRTLAQGQGRHFDASHIHDVANEGTETAVSLHAYSPSLPAMTRYELLRGRLVVTSVEHRGDLW